MLDWIFEGIVNWVSSIVAELMDTVSGLFLDALGTDMTAMEEYFPFVSSAFTVLQYTAWAILFLITVWQLFRVFGGPITDAENPWMLAARSALFALLIGLRETHLRTYSGHCPGTLHGPNGHHHVGGGLHFCRDKAGTVQWPGHVCGSHIDYRTIAHGYFGNRFGLELF